MADPAEAKIRELHAAGDYRASLTEALGFYGAELKGYLRARALDPDVDELYAEVCARLVESLPGFEWRSSFRTWMYQIARFAWIDRLRRRSAAEIPLSQVSRSSAFAARVSEVPSHLGPAAEARLLAVRAELDPDDRALLYLRVDREMDWRDVALAMADEAPSDEELGRQTAALRKRFERLKERIRRALDGG